MLVSFIIPSYNSAHTVTRCLDSIYALPLQPEEFEVVFIDDCSCDDQVRNNTTDIVSRYSSAHPNLTLLRQPFNNRQGAARNRGVSMAQGEYICFVDSDDAVTPGLVSALRLAEQCRTEMLAFHYARADEQGQISGEAARLTYTPGQFFTGICMQNDHPYWCSAPWGFIYSRSFLTQVNYPFVEGALYEDSDFVAVHLYHAHRMTYSPDMGYIAYFRNGSTTHTCCYQHTADYLLLGTRMLAFYSFLQQDAAQPQAGILSQNEDAADEQKQRFAESVLRGACFNISKSLGSLYKLGSLQAIRAFYASVDARVDRRQLAADKRLFRYPGYWGVLPRLALKHKHLAIAIHSLLAVLYKASRKKYTPRRGRG